MGREEAPTVDRFPTFRLAMLLAPLATASVSADVVRLENGGEARGALPGERLPGASVMLDSFTGARIVLHADSIKSTSRRPPEVEEYTTRSRLIPHTVEAHWELAEWCKARQLAPQREEQLEAVVELDPVMPQRVGHWGTSCIRVNG